MHVLLCHTVAYRPLKGCNFHVDMKNTQKIRRLLRHTSKFATNIFSTNNISIGFYTGIKISTFFWRKMGR